MFIYNLSFSNCSFLATHTQSKSKHQQAYYFTDQHFHLDSEKVHAKNHDENCIGKCIKFNLIVVLVTLCWLNKVLKNSDQRSCHGFHTFRDVGSGGAEGRTPPTPRFSFKKWELRLLPNVKKRLRSYSAPHYNSPSQIFRPSGIPAHEKTQAFKSR